MTTILDWHGEQVYMMENDRLQVYLCPAIGNNLFRIRDLVLDREVIRVPDTPATLKENPIHYGCPLLMPPSRIREGKFHYRGRDYQFEINSNGHHIHGLIKSRPWRVTETVEGSTVQAVTCTLSTSDFPDLIRQYPHDLTFAMTYVLEESSLVQKLTVTNQGKEAAPFGYGVHTWFNLDSEPDQWTLSIPVSGNWEFGSDGLPTGNILPLGSLSGFNETGGLNMEGLDLDAVLYIGDKPATAVLSRPGCEIRCIASDEYKHWVIYTRGRANQWVCIEPYTWVTNAPNLPLDPSVTGLRAIEPGETLQLEMALDIVSSASV
jgi:aldose 1-epimerase